MDIKSVTLRCEDGAEAVVFTKYTYEKAIMKLTDGIVKFDNTYEINIQDDYTGGNYRGFFGRIKRAWRAFWDKPVIYTGIYSVDKDKMRKFLSDCLSLIDENDVEQIKTMYDEIRNNGSVTSNEELIKEGKW